jgi:hypothetical protein
MKRMLSLLLVLPLLLCSCGSDGDFVPSAELVAAAQCLGISLEDLAEMYDEVVGMIGSLGGVLPANVNYDYNTGVYTITASFGTISGVVTSLDDLDDGLGVPESATATWETGSLAGAPAFGASGTFTVVRPSTPQINISGTGMIVDGTCAFDMTALNLSENNTSTLGAVGTFAFSSTVPEGVLAGTMIFNGTSTALVDATFDGEDVSFYFNLDTFEPIF